jgi:hypothetical protein
MSFFTPDYQDFDDKVGTEELLEYTKHSSSTMRFRAFNKLMKTLKRDDALKHLQHLVDDPDRKVSSEAAYRLLAIGCDYALERAREILSDGRWEDKIKVLSSLTDYTGEDRNGAKNLIMMALKDKKMIVTVEALKALGSYKGDVIVEKLDEYLHDKHFQIRKEAVLSLGRSGGEKIIDKIVGCIIDKHEEVRFAAKKALEAIGTEKALEILKQGPFMKLIKCMNECSTMRVNTVRQIGEKGLREGIPLLIRGCSDEYKQVRIESARSLSSFHDPEHIDIFIKMLEDKYYDVRLEALFALGMIRSPRSLEFVEKCMKDKNVNVRNAAREVYYSLSDRLEKKSHTRD